MIKNNYIKPLTAIAEEMNLDWHLLEAVSSKGNQEEWKAFIKKINELDYYLDRIDKRQLLYEND